MIPLDTITKEDLQFSHIIGELENYLYTPRAHVLAQELEIMTDRNSIERRKDTIDELLSLFSETSDFGLTSLFEVDSWLPGLKRAGYVLDGQSLWAALGYMNCSVTVKNMVYRQELELPILKERISQLPDLSGAQRKLKEYLIAPGEVREDHPRIRALTMQLGQQRTRRSELIKNYTSTHSRSLQSPQAVIREGRLVLPVTAKDKQQFKGIVHSSSSSGNTLFMEPFDLIDCNNSVALAQSRLQQEIHAIYRELTEAVASVREELELCIDILGEYDLLCAMARHCDLHGYTRASSTGSSILLKQVTHPILGSGAIGIDVDIDEDVHIVVTSGPNAGGKTVTMKTIGYAVLLNQLGMFIPAREGSNLPIFSSIHTDIGDSQSIEQSLSTFSGHLKRISSIVAQVDRDALVILDELGTGTDPKEGAAFGQAVLEHLLQRVALTLVTSHHDPIKQFAQQTPGCTNASMEFDADVKRPTYRLVFGQIGTSHALDTAEGLDFPPLLIQRAWQLLGTEAQELSEALKSVKLKEQQLEGQLKQLEKEKEEVVEQRRRNDLKALSVRQKEYQLKNKELTVLKDLIEESRSRLENSIRELREQGLSEKRVKEAREQIEKVTSVASRQKERLQHIGEQLKASARREAPVSGPLTIGQQVIVTQTGRRGVILARAKKGSYTVRLDNGMTLTLDDTRLVPEREEKKSPSASWVQQTSEYEQYSSMARSSIDVRGMTLSEAIVRIENAIDAALISGLSELSIIHGKGEGILARGIHETLGANPVVKEVHFAHPEDGGYGKSYITL